MERNAYAFGLTRRCKAVYKNSRETPGVCNIRLIQYTIGELVRLPILPRGNILSVGARVVELGRVGLYGRPPPGEISFL